MYKTTALFNVHRGHGGERRIRTSSPAYEAGVLPLHHHRDIFKAHYVAFSIPKTDAFMSCCLCLFLYKYYIKIFKESQIL